MKKIWIIIKREYLSRIVKKSFLFTTLLVPLLMGAAMFIMIKVGSTTKDHLKVLVVDESQLFIESIDKMNNGEDLVFKPMIESIPLENNKKTYVQ